MFFKFTLCRNSFLCPETIASTRSQSKPAASSRVDIMYLVIRRFPPSELPLLHASLIDEDLNNGVHIAAVLDRSSWLRKAVAVEVLLREGDVSALPRAHRVYESLWCMV